MITREQFGPYLLLKKLSEDPLGETFRAGRIGNEAMEQVVLLRVFNGSALEGEDLWSQISDRGPIQQALKSPNIGNGVDLGQVHGVPYVAYDYISGKNLGNVLEQVTKSSHPVPLEHALLVAERLSLGLAVAYETRVQSQRVLHGFLVPQLILLSNEGENRILGFEVAPGLRKLATHGPLKEISCTYLSPETLAGAEPTQADDVYSLGAILLELLIGRPLPAPSPGGYEPLIREIITRGPAEVGALIDRSVAPAADRISDVVAWHKALSKILVEGQYRATTFNLAFFMHNLFRDEIEKESQEIELERTIEIPPQKVEPAPAMPETPRPAAAATPAPAPTPTPIPIQPQAGQKATREVATPSPQPEPDVAFQEPPPLDMPAPAALEETPTPPSGEVSTVMLDGPAGLGEAPTGYGEDSGSIGVESHPAFSDSHGGAAAKEGGSKRMAIIAAAVVVVLGVGGYFAWQYLPGIGTQETLAETTTAAAPVSPVAGSGPDLPPETSAADPLDPNSAEPGAGLDEEDPGSSASAPVDVDALVAEKMERELEARDAELKSLREKARKAEEEAERLRKEEEARQQQREEEARKAQAQREAEAQKPQPAASDAASEKPASESPGTGDSATSSTSPRATAPSQPQPTAEVASKPAVREPLPRSVPPPNNPTPTTTRAPQPRPTNPTPTQPPAPRVRLGDLVQPGPGVIKPRLRSPIEPRYPQMARRMKKEADVQIMVLVDENGRVLDHRLPEKKVGFGFEESAVQAARRAKFAPATKSGVAVKIWHSIKIQFRLEN